MHEWEVEERTVDVDGDTAAIPQRLRMVATVLGEDRRGTIVMSDICRRREDGWRVWRRHSTPLEPGASPCAVDVLVGDDGIALRAGETDPLALALAA